MDKIKKIKKIVAKEKWVSIVLATVCLTIILSQLSPAFIQLDNLKNIFVQSSYTGIMAVGMTFIILTGGIDISVGAILFFTGSLFAQMVNSDVSAWAAIGITIVCASLLGALNGVLIVKTKMAPFITTLATYNVYRGLALQITNAGNIPVPKSVGFLGTGKIIGIPVPTVLFIICLLVGVYLLQKTKFGTYIKAIGNSQKSATESGLPVKTVTILAYTAGGFAAGLAALILIGRIGGLQSGMGIGMEFTVIAAVVLGGTKLSGGSGTVFGSVIGAIFLILINNGLNLMEASPFIYDTVKGLILIVAVVVDRISSLRQSKAMLEQKAERIRHAV